MTAACEYVNTCGNIRGTFSPIASIIPNPGGITSAVHPPSRPPIRPTKPHQTPRPIPLFPITSVTTTPTNLAELTTEFVPVSSSAVGLSVNHSNNFFGASTIGGTIDNNFIQDDEGKPFVRNTLTNV